VVGDAQKCVAMPYDRIKHGLQDKYYASHEYNICRITKGKENESDTESNNVYTRSEQYWKDWNAKGVVVEDAEPAIYAYYQEFDVNGKKMVRRGFCAMVELEDYGKGVKPHEKTLDAPKEDRFKLLVHTDTHFGQIFQLYPDDTNEIADILSPLCQREPDIETTIDEEPGVVHKVWAVTDEDAIARLQAAMKDRLLFIADGHHRYETALNYRNYRLTQYTGGPDGHNPRYAMMTMVGMSDPGLVVLPTLRIIHSLPYFDFDRFLHNLASHFKVEAYANIDEMQDKLDAAAHDKSRNAYGLYHDGKYWYIELTDHEIMSKLAPEHTEAWRSLDVAVLHEVVLEKILGISKEEQAAKANISYERDRAKGHELVDNGSHHFLVFMNPTLMSQIRDVAGNGEVMPQKSTDFYPKLITGLVMCKVDLGQRRG
jgi:uncharacterized protein (DUF1015 family)